MPYITGQRRPNTVQLTWADLYDPKRAQRLSLPNHDTRDTRTIFTDTVSVAMREKCSISDMIQRFQAFNELNQPLYQNKLSSYYRRFYIPKKSGKGKRLITTSKIPNKMDLFYAQQQLRALIESIMPFPYHTSAFAYIKGRRTGDAAVRHQQNDSHWFLKLDFSDFFTSITKKFFMQQLSLVFPFSEMMQTAKGEAVLSKAMDMCFYNGTLPMGTPISPLLTNILMIPIDYQFSRKLQDVLPARHVYTRYCDDMMISSRRHFNKWEVINCLREILRSFHAPLRLNNEKTSYIPRSVGVWILGINLGADNRLTLGDKHKHRLELSLMKLIEKYRYGHSDIRLNPEKLQGELEYWRNVCPKDVERRIAVFEQRHQVSIKKLFKQAINDFHTLSYCPDDGFDYIQPDYLDIIA